MQGTSKKDSTFNASLYRVGIVAARFNAAVTDAMVESALGVLAAHNVPQKNITVHRVAGSVEIPVILKALAQTGKYDALVAIGAVVRGETDHYDYVARMASEGVLRAMMDSGVPVGFAVLTCETSAQAEKRVHVGGEAAAAALECARIIRDEQ